MKIYPLICLLSLSSSVFASCDTPEGTVAIRNAEKTEVTVLQEHKPFYVVSYRGTKVKPQENSDRLPTFNQSGYTEIHPDVFMKMFLMDCHQFKDLLDVGSAFGYWSKKALVVNPKLNISLVDPDARHLSIAWKNMASKTHQKLREENKGDYSKCARAIYKGLDSFKESTLTTHCGGVEICGLLGNDSADVALMSDVIAYLTPQKLELGLANIFDALRPGGKLYIKTPSPSSHYVTGTYLTSWYYYLASLFKENPGYMWFFHILSPDYAQTFPGGAHFLSKECLESFVRKAGFEISQNFYYPKHKPNAYVGLIAKKPVQQHVKNTFMTKPQDYLITLQGDSLVGLLYLPTVAKSFLSVVSKRWQMLWE